MAIEAELKAVVRDPEAVMAQLEEAYGPGRPEVYQDTYYDLPTGALTSEDRELRIRHRPRRDRYPHRPDVHGRAGR